MGIKTNTIIIDHQTQIDDNTSNLDGHISHYGSFVHRNRNPNHLFNIHNQMRNENEILYDEEVADRRYVVRTIHDRTNRKFIDIRVLWWCRKCSEWANGGLNTKIPIKVGKLIFKEIGTLIRKV